MISAQVCHERGERVRLHLEGVDADQALQELFEKMSEHPLVQKFRFNPRTGSLTFWIDGGLAALEPSLCADWAMEVSTPRESISAGERLFRAFKGANGSIDGLLKKLSAGHVDLLTVFGGVLVWAAYRQWRRKHFFPASLPILALAFSQFNRFRD